MTRGELERLIENLRDNHDAFTSNEEVADMLEAALRTDRGTPAAWMIDGISSARPYFTTVEADALRIAQLPSTGIRVTELFAGDSKTYWTVQEKSDGN